MNNDVPDLIIGLRGSFRMIYKGSAIDFPSGRVRLLLVFLLLHPRGVDRSKLAGIFWPESTEDQARTNLRRELHTLRKHLPLAEKLLVSTKTTLRLVETSEVFLDLEGSEDLLSGEDAPWLEGIRQELEARRVARLEKEVSEAEARGDLRAALGGLKALLSLDPLREELHRQKMRLHRANGDRGAALQAYQDCLSLLDEELGVAPSAPTRALHEQMLSDTAPAVVHQGMVGRDAEWMFVVDWLEIGLLEKSAPLLWVRGEPGIGKSRILAELAAEVKRREGCLAKGRCYEAERNRPFVPWQEALPDLQGLLLKGAEEGNRAMLFENVVKQLCSDEGTSLRLLIIDDLQWVDEASAALIHFAYRSGRMMICCASRVAELESNPHAFRLIRALTREKLIRRLELGPLSEEAIRELAPDTDPSRCGGNPLLALELARATTEGGESIQELLEGRLSGLSSPGRELVSWAAALGSDFSALKLRQVCGRTLMELLDALEELEKHSLLKATGEKYDFAHDIVRQTVYESLSGPRRQLLHLQIAQSLDGDAHPGEVAHHAVLGGDSTLAARACKDGCFEYLKVLAFHEAHGLAVTGLKHAGEVKESWEVKVELYRGLLLSGIPESQEAFWRESFAKLTANLAEMEEPGLQAKAKSLSTIWDYDRQLVESVQVRSAEAVELARLTKPRQAAHVLAHSASCFLAIRRDIPKARLLIEEAGQLARQAGLQVLELYLAQGLLDRFEGRDGEAERKFNETVALAERKQDFWRSVVALTQLCMLKLEQGENEQVVRLSRELGEAGRRLGPGSEGAVARCMECLALSNREAFLSSVEELRRVDNRRMLAYCLRHGYLKFGESSFLLEGIEAARGVDLSELVLTEAVLAEVRLQKGELELVREVVKEHRLYGSDELTAEAREARVALRRRFARRAGA